MSISNLTEEEKKRIDSMSLESMLYKWRFEPSSTGYFQGDRGKYFSNRMFKLRDANPKEWAAASKRIGWDK